MSDDEKLMLNSPIRFLSKVRTTSHGCWEWIASLDGKGYGQYFFEGRVMKAYRVAYILAAGSVPSGLSVLHKCDNPCCVRPSHLFLGTQGDNVRDCVSKGRMHFQVNRPTHCKRGHEFTEENSVIDSVKTGQRSCKTCRNTLRKERRRIARENRRG